MCFTSLYIYILDLFTPSLQFIFLFCFYEILKKIEENNFSFLFNGTFLSDGIVLCLCCAQAVYYSSFTMLCIWPVGCVLRELYSQSALQTSKPPLWALVQMPCSICSFCFMKKKRKKSDRGGGGGWKWRGGTEKRGPFNNCWTLLTSQTLLDF